MERTLLRRDKGVAGLNILLSVVVFLFIIGFLVMIFAIIGAQIEEEAYEATSATLTNITTETVVNESGAFPTGLNIGLYACKLTVTEVYNGTAGGTELIASGNYTTSNCQIVCDGCDTTHINNTLWNVTGTYTYDANTTSSLVAASTTSSLGDVTDWFGIIIVITAMVVLILLTVIIISTLRESGFIAVGGSSRPTETA